MGKVDRLRNAIYLGIIFINVYLLHTHRLAGVG